MGTLFLKILFDDGKWKGGGHSLQMVSSLCYLMLHVVYTPFFSLPVCHGVWLVIYYAPRDTCCKMSTTINSIHYILQPAVTFRGAYVRSLLIVINNLLLLASFYWIFKNINYYNTDLISLVVMLLCWNLDGELV